MHAGSASSSRCCDSPKASARYVAMSAGVLSMANVSTNAVAANVASAAASAGVARRKTKEEVEDGKLMDGLRKSATRERAQAEGTVEPPDQRHEPREVARDQVG